MLCVILVLHTCVAVMNCLLPETTLVAKERLIDQHDGVITGETVQLYTPLVPFISCISVTVYATGKFEIQLRYPLRGQGITDVIYEAEYGLGNAWHTLSFITETRPPLVGREGVLLLIEAEFKKDVVFAVSEIMYDRICIDGTSQYKLIVNF